MKHIFALSVFRGCSAAFARAATLFSVLALASCVAPTSGGQPDIGGAYSGGYTYGPGYSKGLSGKMVPFNISIDQAPGSARFKGVITEPYSGFGVAREGKLWADIEGSCSRAVGGSTAIQFKKTYRYFSQESVSYRGSVGPGSSTLTGTWMFGSQPDLTGTFVLHHFPAR